MAKRPPSGAEEIVFENIIQELRNRPFTLILLLGLWASVALLWSAEKGFASTHDIIAVRLEVDGIKYSVQKASLQSQLREIESELFRLKRTVDDLQKTGKPVEQIYWDRISSLSSDQENLQRELKLVMEKAPPT